MKLLALRVREVGGFSDPVAVEGLSGGFDVLAGANEAGKSTLFRALETLFLESYKTESQKLRDVLVPYRGGAPCIEADIEVDGTVWRYRKQYFAGRMAELRSLGTGDVLKNADAETRMLGMLGGAASTGLLWVRQRDGLDPLPPDAAGRGLLLAAVEHEVADIAGGRATEAVRQAAAAELAKLVTGKTQRPRGSYKAALDRVSGLTLSLVAAEAAATAAEQHMAALAQLREEAVLLSAPATAVARQEILATIDRQIADDDRLARDLETASERRDHLAAQASAAAQAAARFSQGLEAASQMAREIAEAAQSVATLQEEIGRRKIAAGQALAVKERMGDAEHRCEEAIARAIRWREAERLRVSVSEAQALAAERARQTVALANNTSSAHAIQRIEAEARDIAILEARLAAAAPVVEVVLDKKGLGKVRADGVPLTADHVFRPLVPLDISVPGVAAIRVAPASTESQADLTADLIAHRQTLQNLLRSMGADSLEAARVKAGERRALEAAVADATSRLAVLAPEGLSAIEAAFAAAAAKAAPLPEDQTNLDTLQRQLAVARTDAGAAAAAHVAAETALTAAATGHAVATARIEERRRSLAALSAELPPASERPARDHELSAANVLAAHALTEAVATVTVLSRRRLPATERQRLVAQRTEIAGERDRAEWRLREIERAAARLEGLIESDSEAATGIELERLGAERGQARRDVTRIEAEVAGLTLLEEVFQSVTAEAESQFLQPVLQRLAPLLRAILGADGAALGADLGLTGIVRDGRAEPAERLSTGTREQIAVLVRLAFGDILAKAGRPVPLILDDALVYSDDERLLKMLELLRNAALCHQVVLLSCRTRVMAEAGFSPLPLRPWRA